MAIPVTEAREHVASLFIAYLGRAPEYQASNFYIGQLNRYVEETEGNVGDAVLRLSAEIFHNAVGAGEFPDPQSLTTEEFVTAVYGSALGREPDEDGLAYYTELLDNGEISREIFVQLVLDNARGQEEGSRDRAFIENRTQVAVEFSRFENSNPDKLPLLPYDAKTILEGVNEDPATVEAALEQIANAGNIGEGFHLTVNEDNLVGTGADDTFHAPIELVNGGATPTLQDFDTVNGGGGRDTLNASLVAGGLVAPTLSSVEVLNLRVVDGGAESVFNLANVTGAEEVWNIGSNADATLSVVEASTDVTYGIANTAADLNIDLADGDDGELKLAFQNVRGSAVTVAQDVEAVSLDVTGDNAVDLAGLGATVETLTIAGSGSLEVEGFDSTALTTLDASEFSDDLTLDISDATSEELSVTTGAGDDRITINAAVLAEGNTAAIDLGEGDNVLVLTGNDVVPVSDLDFASATIAGVSVLEFASDLNVGADVVLDLEGLDTETLVFAGTVTGASTLTLDNTATTLDVTFEADVTGPTFDFATAEELTVNVEASVTDATITGAALTSLVVQTTEDEASFTGTIGSAANGEAAESVLTTLTLDDASEAGDGAFDVTLVNTTELDTIVLSGGEGSTFNIDGSGAAFAGAVTIEIGAVGIDVEEGTVGVAYDATDSAVRETFQFTGEDIGTIEITGFQGGIGATADRLDFSQFDDIGSGDDLIIEYDGTDTVITAAGGQFDGSITVLGVDISQDSANFIF